jgi:hypothetical protein
VGAAVGLACAAEEGDDAVSPEQCFAGRGHGRRAGNLIDVLVRTDVWAPAQLPSGAERSGVGSNRSLTDPQRPRSHLEHRSWAGAGVPARLA